MTPIQQLMLGAGGVKKVVGIDDVFKTYVYKGTSSALTINNGIDLTKGGMVWSKFRSHAYTHTLVDTERGTNSQIYAQGDDDADTYTDVLTSFNNNGFTLGSDTNGLMKYNNYDSVSWTFRKQEKFFTIKTYQGTGSSVLTLSHDLGSVPGMILIKRLNGSASDWIVYHRSTGITKYLQLNESDAAADDTGDYLFNNVAPTATHFTIGAGHDAVNANTNNYVAYLFAHEEAEFGPNSDQKIISCGSYSGTGSAGLSVTLPFEPSFLIVKNATSSSQDWIMWDSMRGVVTGQNDPIIRANLNNAEATDTDHMSLTPTGFKVTSTNDGVNKSGDTYIYIAIAAETGKTINSKNITAGTDVFAMDTSNSSSTIPSFDSGFPVDFALARTPDSSGSWHTTARLTGTNYLDTTATSAQNNFGDFVFDSNLGWCKGSTFNSSYQSWMWKRHAGFDVVAYDGTGSARTQSHNLGVVPEMMWVKCRSNASTYWIVHHKGLSTPTEKVLYLNATSSEQNATTWAWNGTAPTSSVFSLGSDGYVNGSSRTYIAMLFASVDGISKCGFYDGSGSTITLNLGFQPRFFMTKRANATSGDWTSWFILDTTRGWGSGQEQWLRLDNTDTGGDHDFGAPTSTGISLTGGDSNYNDSGGKYIFYAHA